MSLARRVDSAESGVLPGRSDVAESVAAARSSCSLGSSLPAVLLSVCYLSLLSLVVSRLLTVAAAAADDDDNVWVLQGLRRQKCTHHSEPDFLKLQ